jgi:hemerythrin-like domain-containing protein
LSTESLRKDHKLIEKVLQALDATIKLLKDGKQIPEDILLPTIDFTQNFTDICHHGKEEEALFPALEKAGMPSHMGPIRMMIIDHQRTKTISKKIGETSKKYLETNDSIDLILALEVYVQHVTEHLWKENNRLFMMAEARLNHAAKDVNKNLRDVEERKLKELGKTRSDYEILIDDLEKSVSEIK